MRAANNPSTVKRIKHSKSLRASIMLFRGKRRRNKGPNLCIFSNSRIWSNLRSLHQTDIWNYNNFYLENILGQNDHSSMVCESISNTWVTSGRLFHWYSDLLYLQRVLQTNEGWNTVLWLDDIHAIYLQHRPLNKKHLRLQRNENEISRHRVN